MKTGLFDLYNDCKLCPRECGVNRNRGQRGFCAQGAELRLAAAGLHFGEEPPITGSGGSGTIFVSGCNLRCSFCQNYQISGEQMGKTVSSYEFAGICILLQKNGAENINIVTGSHAVPAIITGLQAAKEAGLTLPVLWNSSAYESIETLALLNDHIDMYLPDLKTLNPQTAANFFGAADYPKKAVAALKYLITTHKQLIIRHLVLPGYLEDTRQVLRWYKENAAGAAEISIMTQYTPVKRDAAGNAPARYINETEYEAVLAVLEEYGIENGYYQELETGSDWLPDFTKENPFGSKLSKILWHWKDN